VFFSLSCLSGLFLCCFAIYHVQGLPRKTGPDDLHSDRYSATMSCYMDWTWLAIFTIHHRIFWIFVVLYSNRIWPMPRASKHIILYTYHSLRPCSCIRIGSNQLNTHPYTSCSVQFSLCFPLAFPHVVNHRREAVGPAVGQPDRP